MKPELKSKYDQSVYCCIVKGCENHPVEYIRYCKTHKTLYNIIERKISQLDENGHIQQNSICDMCGKEFKYLSKHKKWCEGRRKL